MSQTKATACLRCRRRNRKCDQKLPKCGLCESTGAECVAFDTITKRRLPRSYICGLENRIAYLELKLQQNGVALDDDMTTGSINDTMISISDQITQAGSPPDIAEPMQADYTTPALAATTSTAVRVDHIVQQIRKSQHSVALDEPAFTRLLLQELVKSQSVPRQTGPTEHTQNTPASQFIADLTEESNTTPVMLPSIAKGHQLVKAYFHITSQSLPLLHETMLSQKLDLLYTMPRTIDLAQTHTDSKSRLAVFFVFGVFAVGLLVLQKHDPARISTALAERYFRVAVRALEQVGLQNSLEGVQALLLVAQYSYHHSITWATWKTVGSAMRLGVELGLHCDVSSENVDPLTLDTMRRTFWVAYAMDRNILSSLGLPSCLADGAITAKFPSQEPDEYITESCITPSADNVPKPKRVSIHVLRYRQIQSELRTVLYEKVPANYRQVDLPTWQQQMHQRIQRWYDDTPHKSSLTTREAKNLENFELTYHRGIFHLYEPTPNIPVPAESSLVIMTEAATRMIHLYRRFFTENRLSIFWQAVENLYSAGVALLHAYACSVLVRAAITFANLEASVHTCSSVLWGMVEHFPDFKGKRDSFDLIVSQTFEELRQKDVAQGFDAHKHSDNVVRDDGEHTAFTTPLPNQATAQQHWQPATLGQSSDSNTLVMEPAFAPQDLDDFAFDWSAFEADNNGPSTAWP